MNVDFIPAQENTLYLTFFRFYIRLLFKLRFSEVIIQKDYLPKKTSSSLYVLNHHYWWDGLIPLYLNQWHLHQKGRAIMEDKQLRKYSFFSRLGAFSINRDEKKNLLSTLRYALDWLASPGHSLFIYPQGKFVSERQGSAHFEKGAEWIVKKCHKLDVVPVAIKIDLTKSSKPRLWIHIGQAFSEAKPTTESMQTKLSIMLENIDKKALI